MRELRDLERMLLGLDGRGYRAYKAIEGSYRGDGFTLHVDHVQGDPYAAPSRVRVTLPAASARLPDWAVEGPARRVAAADFLHRSFLRAVDGLSSRRGSGRSGEIRVVRPGQEVLARTAVSLLDGQGVEARFYVGLPAAGRRILGRQAAELLGSDVAAGARAGLRFEALDAAALRRHVETVEDARAVRERLEDLGLVAFVADGAVLPRRSGVDDRPLQGDTARPFVSPPGLRVTVETPNSGAVTGMGVPRGVTLVAGGGYHGKSTLLRALERGVYDHLPGDGRERVVTVPGAVKIRAEDGRRVTGVDISNFIDGLPGGEDTRRFTTDNASGSTSQAAAIVEALEVGARCLLVDEDTSATNFMIRDARMQELVSGDEEPITPFIDRVRLLYEEQGVSTVLVVGGSGDYFDVADTVLAMRTYLPGEVTARAREVARRHPTKRRREGGGWRPLRERRPLPSSLDPSRGRREVSIRASREDRVLYGTQEVDLTAVDQIVETAQARAMARALAWGRARGAIDGTAGIGEALGRIMERIEQGGLESIQERLEGDLASFRIHELAAFLNRIRSLRTAREHPAPAREGAAKAPRRG